MLLYGIYIRDSPRDAPRSLNSGENEAQHGTGRHGSRDVAWVDMPIILPVDALVAEF